MRRAAACLMMVGCTTNATTVYAPPDAAAEDALDSAPETSTVDAVPDAVPMDVEVPDAGGDALADAAVEASPVCPADMRTTDAGLCLDMHEVRADSYREWLGEAGATSCSQPGADAGVRVQVSWCGANAWCATHGKRLCSFKEWKALCAAYTATDPGGSVEWHADEQPEDGGHYSGDWEGCATLPPSDGEARIRCCKDQP